jgi:hypothetical protein
MNSNFIVSLEFNLYWILDHDRLAHIEILEIGNVFGHGT